MNYYLGQMKFLYRNGGLNYRRGYLSKVFPDVIDFSQEEQAKLADLITQRYATNELFCERQANDWHNSPNAISPNIEGIVTGIGNAAYMALHCHPLYREEFQHIYKCVIELVRKMKTTETETKTKENKEKKVNDSQRISWPHRAASALIVNIIDKPVAFLLNGAFVLGARCAGYTDDQIFETLANSEEKRRQRAIVREEEKAYMDLESVERKMHVNKLKCWLNEKTDPLYDQKVAAKRRELAHAS